MAILNQAQLQAASDSTYTSNGAQEITAATVRTLNNNWISSSALLDGNNVFEGNQTINGDLTVTGSLIATASFASTSSFAVTASFLLGSVESASYAENADNAVSASFATDTISASFAQNANTAISASQATNANTATSSSHAQDANNAISASFATNALSASFVLQSTSASYALSASYAATASGADIFQVRTELTASGLNYPTADGLEGQVLKTDGTNDLSFGDVNTLFETIYTGENITKGDPLYISGSQGANPIVYKADAGNAAKMPVIYVASETVASGNTTRGIVLGLIEGIDLTGYTAGTEIYVAVGGGWTSTRPTGSAIVQILGIVTKGGNGGKGLVLNPGPVELPNLQAGFTWVGDATGVPAAVSTGSINASTAVSSSYASNATSASFASNATSASHALNANTAISASNALNADNSNTLNGANSASFAQLGANNIFTGNQNTIQGNLFISGNLYVSGAEVILSSSTLIVGDRIIELNANLVNGPAGIYAFDVTAPTTTGSLLWEPTLNYWVAGDINNETKVITAADTGSLSVASASYALTASYAENAPVIDTGSFATTGSNQFNGNQTITGSILLTGKIESTGSLLLQPNQSDPRYLEIYNTSPTDIHITASGGQIFLGDDATYVKVDNYGSVKRIDIVADNGLNISGSTQITGSLSIDATHKLITENISANAGNILTIDGTNIIIVDTVTPDELEFYMGSNDQFKFTEVNNALTLKDDLRVDSDDTFFRARLDSGTGLYEIRNLNDGNPGGPDVEFVVRSFDNRIKIKSNDGGVYINDGVADFLTVPSGSSLIDVAYPISSSNGFTGSLEGTASFAVTASYAINADIDTSTFATTGSNTFDGDQTINDTFKLTTEKIDHPTQTTIDAPLIVLEDSVGSALVVEIGGITCEVDQGAQRVTISNQLSVTGNSGSVTLNAGDNTYSIVGADAATLIEFKVQTGDNQMILKTDESGSYLSDGVNNFLTVLSGSNSVGITGSLSITGSVYGNVNALSISSNTASLDLTKGDFFTLQLVSGSNTFINPTNIRAGQTVNLLISTTGSATVSFPTTVEQVSGSSYIPTATTGKDIVTLIAFDTTNLYLANVKNLV